MKKITLLLALLVGFQVASAQKGKVSAALMNVENGTLDKAIAPIKAAEQHEKTATWAKTYYAKGRVYQAIHEDKTGLYSELADNAIDLAWEAFQKAIELDAKDEKGKGRVRKQVIKYLSVKNPNDPATVRENIIMRDAFINEGVEGFNTKDFARALKAFEGILIIDALPEFQTVDTAIFYYAAAAAQTEKKYDDALRYYDKALALNYEGAKIYKQKADIIKLQGDTAQSIAMIKEGLGVFPEDYNLLIDLVNYYLTSGESQEAIKFLTQALENEPDNHSLYFAMGVSYDLLKDPVEAEKAYRKAIEINPEYFEAYFNLAAIFYNKGAESQNAASNIPPKENKKYDAKIKEAKEFYKESLPFFEKAHEIKPKDRDAMLNLKEIYTKTQQYEKSKAIKEELDALD